MNETGEPEKRIFTFAEAQALLPEIRLLTETAKKRVDELQGEAEHGGPGERLEAEANLVVRVWAATVKERGLDVKGLWLVDFDNGSGYYCWKYPEPALEYYHSYEEGFRGRLRIH